LFEDIKEAFLNFITSRIFVLIVVFLLFFGILLGRVFYLQIIRGEDYAESFTLKIKKEISIASTRGRIFDRNGEVLADNKLSYSVTIEDNGTYDTTKEKNKTLNKIISKVIDIVKSHGDRMNSDFGIILVNGQYEFTQKGTSLNRFKADVYGRKTIEQMKPEEYVSTANDIMDYLCGRYSISDEDYTPERRLEIVNVRYAMNLNNYKRYVVTTIASDVSDLTVAEIQENLDILQGVNIEQNSLRVYEDAKYFASLIGYIGKPSQKELDNLKLENENYELNDIVGKAGLEQYMETELQGVKGHRTIYVDSMGNVLEVEEETRPQSGNDIYLTIDKNLQKAVYQIIEQQLAGILISKIKNIKEYIPTAKSASGDILIPIYDVYYALLNNHVIDAAHFKAEDATELEQSVEQRILSRLDVTIQQVMSELQTESPRPYKDLPDDMKNYMSYIVSDILMGDADILVSSSIDREDSTYNAWAKDRSISLKEYLQYAIAKNWVDVSGLEVDKLYLNSEEIYAVLMEYISTTLANDADFEHIMYKYMILDDIVSGKEVCLLLYDQGVLEYDEETIGKLRNGTLSAYNFMLDKIRNLEITPAQLALEPCSAGCVITDPKTGDVLACVSYPGYDNNRLTNTMDSAYFASLNKDKAGVMYSRATQEQTAPGSTLKPVVAVAGIEEGVITPQELIHATGVFTDGYGSPACWIYRQFHRTHGKINVVDAIKVSCNYYFYEVGFRLGGGRSTGYSSEKALEILAKYASMFGLDEKSGIEVAETPPHLSDSDGIRSSIGQGTYLFSVSQLARYINTIANKGNAYQLTLLDKLTDSSGNTIEDYAASVYNNMEISDSSWSAIQEGLHQVALDTKAFQKLDLTVAGKTGTAQQSKTHPPHALFIGYAPYENPEIGIAIRIANGYTSANAAAMVADIFRYYFELVDNEELLTGTASQATTEIIND